MTGIPVCYYALGKWQAKMFKKLGWMLLMKAKATENASNSRYTKFYNSKVLAYMNSINALIAATENKMNEGKGLEQSYKVMDLKILLDNAHKLKIIAEGCLGTKPESVPTTLDLAGGARRPKKSSKKSAKRK